MHHTILGRRWKIRFGRLRRVCGQCDHPQAKAKEIAIDSRLRGVARLDTILHEGLHAALWALDEETVNTTATDLASLLWRLGYRRGDDE